MHQSIKQSNNQSLMLHVCVCACACGMFLLNVLCACACASKSNTTNQSNQSHQANMGYIQSTHTCMCISSMHCVCEMHTHAFALHLCSFLWKWMDCHNSITKNTAAKCGSVISTTCCLLKAQLQHARAHSNGASCIELAKNEAAMKKNTARAMAVL